MYETSPQSFSLYLSAFSLNGKGNSNSLPSPLCAASKLNLFDPSKPLLILLVSSSLVVS
jgi:hypothetical protein